ncbi:acyltransferase domain-containing protein [Tumebacillus sp. ITR2]|uniref:Acyltransferase domain-containing protein n=1 Tax=Tumebacillus amylolyticus TaxID=2801339 RepID=A0ABS1J6E7_9BACL|nr:type I polyketide synthase [Tumebacillus amylolyticus]MBL0385639.1 acyltransferase domain-containing protein [Tumebacillus amylolyticus]
MTDRLKQGYEPIAIVGIGCRFPGGVRDPESFWNLLREGVDAVTEVPADRWDTQRFYHPNHKKPDTSDMHWGGFVDDVDKFDPEFFGISPREADEMDPQQRMMLEVSWEALEDAGLRPEKLIGSKTGVYVGSYTSDDQFLQTAQHKVDFLDLNSLSGFMTTMTSNRVSNAFDFQGPSMTIDTACSSSLVAVHLACQSLITGESNLALAGGVNIMVTPHITLDKTEGGSFSPDGRSKAFDSRANGYVRAEGGAMVVLKRLEEALADGDPIYAVIAGSACNQDGSSDGVTVQNEQSQEALMRDALSLAGIEAHQIQYMEAHSTGTSVGEPIEANALGNVLSENRPDGEYCWVGSVKTNIGHTEGAAGVTGLIKAALSLWKEEIPPHLHLLETNPEMDLEALRLRVPTTLQPWEKTTKPRYAGINSFGFGGTNVHVILTEAPAVAEKTEVPSAPTDQLIPLSARTPEALQDVAASYRAALAEGGKLAQVSLADLAHSTALHRGHHPQRMALVVSNKDELLEALDAVVTSETHPRAIEGTAPVTPEKTRRLAFVFTGMGPQWWGMGRQLYAEEPVFRATLDECDRVFQAMSGWSLLEEMLRKDESQSRMEETQISQPAHLFLQIGLTNWWRSMGIEPEAVVGHSAGEAAAAYAAGILSMAEVVRIVYHRSRLQQPITGQGQMIGVGLSESAIRQHLQGYEDRINLAAINSPGGVTLAGETQALEEVLRPLQEADVFVRDLKVGMAFHSHYMNPMKEEFLEQLEGMKAQKSAISYYSSVLGVQADIHELGTEYWWRNLRDTVQFAQAVLIMIEDGYDTFLEIGPHPVLAGSLRECLALKNRTAEVLPSIRRAEAERPQLMSTLGALYTLGYEPNWRALVGQAAFVRLPRYAWQHESYGHETSASRRHRLGDGEAHPLLQQRLSTTRPVWESSLDLRGLPYLGDHRIRGAVAYPEAAYMEMGMAAARTLYGSQSAGFELSDISFEKAFFLNAETGNKVQLHFNGASGHFEVYSTEYESDHPVWTRHAAGTVRPRPSTDARKADLNAWRVQCVHAISKQQAYAHFQSLGLECGPSFQGMEQLWQGQGVAFAELRMPQLVEAEAADYVFHPAMLDIALQMMAAVMPYDGGDRSALFMPVAISQVVLRQAPTPRMWAFARLDEHTDSAVRASITVVDEQGHVVLEVTDLLAQSFQTVAAGQAEAAATVDFGDIYRQTEDHERQELLTEELTGIVSQVLNVPRAKLQTGRSLQTYGLDSMMAIRLKGRLEKTLGSSVSLVDLIQGVSVDELATALRPQVDEWAMLSSVDLEEDLLAELSELSSDELDAMLAEIAVSKED